MAQNNEGTSDSGETDTKSQRNLILQEVMDELDRREKELHSNIYASRDYSDGVRFEIGRMQQWLNEKMET